MTPSALPPVLSQLREDGLLEATFIEKVEREQAEAEEAAQYDDDESLGFSTAEEIETPPHLDILRLCQVGALKGSLSVALDVRADELTGSLCTAIGGSAKKLKLLDVRELPLGVLELEVYSGDVQERWEVEDLYGLVHNLNDLFRADGQAHAVAVLGEWQDMLQLWCIRKSELDGLFDRPYFKPRNHHQLRTLVLQ